MSQIKRPNTTTKPARTRDPKARDPKARDPKARDMPAKAFAVRDALRDMRNQLSMLNHRVGVRLELKDVELDCLDLISRFGPINPSVLARQADIHPATLTGILDRLERAGWILRERETSDRRSVMVRMLEQRSMAVLGLYAGMNTRIEQICADYTPAELELLSGFLQRMAEAGRQSTDELTEG
jgi:DNA-binding MarR family transcriptional regulator